MEGSIVIISVAFTDSSEFKIRPAFVYKTYLKDDFLFCPLTTNLNHPQAITMFEEDLLSGSVEGDSAVLLPKISISSKRCVIKTLGTLKPEVYKKLHTEISKSLNCCTS